MKKLMIITSVVLGLILSLTGCQRENEILRLGSMPTYSAAIYAVGIEQGFYEEAGVNVDLTIFRSARDRDGAATAGELDGFMTDIMGAVNLNAKGFPVTMTSREYEDFGVLSVDEVGGDAPTIGISENTVIEYMVDTYLDYSVEKVSIIAVPDRMGALLAGELDLGVFPQPFMGIIMGKGGTIEFSSASKDFHPVVLAFDKDYLDSNSSAIEAFYEGYIKTIEYMKANDYDEYKDALVTYGLATEETLDFYRLPLDEFGLNSVDKTSYDAVVDWMSNKGILDVEVLFEDVYSSDYVE